jgi:uncharacterized RDD family membrane protein YckC
VTKTCLQCGAILPSSVRACSFCDSSLPASHEASIPRSSAPRQAACFASASAQDTSIIKDALREDSTWHGELAQRVEAYRARRRKHSPDSSQSRFAFEDTDAAESFFPADPHHSALIRSASPSVALEEQPSSEADGDFSFTIAIGRSPATRDLPDGRMEIDVSIPPTSQTPPGASVATSSVLSESSALYPVASLEERRSAAFIDFACLLFAYGGFLALFGSLGGQFTLSKLSAAVYGTSFSIVYLQYFALFTIFGGTTPGMMFRGLQVTSFTGDPATSRQMLLRSLGYLLSAGTFFLGFFWAWWDEDALTWHDRLSRTYLSPQQSELELQASTVAPSHTR